MCVISFGASLQVKTKLMVIVVWATYIMRPIFQKNNKEETILGSTDAETRLSSVALSPLINILDALLQWNQGH